MALTLTKVGNRRGPQGLPGDDAYTVATKNGFVGSVATWLASLKGEKGDLGPKGDQGGPGPQGAPGADADITGATATGLPAGSAPTVQLGGTVGARTLAFGVPKGDQGLKGDTGATGPGQNSLALVAIGGNQYAVTVDNDGNLITNLQSRASYPSPCQSGSGNGQHWSAPWIVVPDVQMLVDGRQVVTGYGASPTPSPATGVYNAQWLRIDTTTECLLGVAWNNGTAGTPSGAFGTIDAAGSWTAGGSISSSLFGGVAGLRIVQPGSIWATLGTYTSSYTATQMPTYRPISVFHLDKDTADNTFFLQPHNVIALTSGTGCGAAFVVNSGLGTAGVTATLERKQSNGSWTTYVASPSLVSSSAALSTGSRPFLEITATFPGAIAGTDQFRFKVTLADGVTTFYSNTFGYSLTYTPMT